MGGRISAPTPPKLGDWAARNAGEVYQAATDGVVIAKSSTVNGQAYIATDANPAPTTIRAGVLSTGGVENSCSCPVKKGDYYKVGEVTPTVTVLWSPWV